MPKASKQTSARSRINDSPIFLLPEIRPCRSRALVRTCHVDLHDQVPVFVGQVLETDIAQDARVIDEHVNTAEVVNRRLDDFLAILHAVIICYCLPPGCLDLVDYYIRSLGK